MNTSRFVSNRYRQILIASLLSSGSLLALNPALADQNTAAGGSTISNQATAEFTDSADATNTPIPITSDTVTVTVAEIAGITIGAIPTTTGVAYRGNTIYVDFKVYNSGNDPTKLFIPGAPSVATYNNGVAFPTGSIGQLEVINYTTVKADGSDNVVTAIPSGAGRTVATTGSSTSALTGVVAAAAGGSIPAGAYITVRVPITIPQAAINGQKINITLGNTGGTDANNASYSAATPATDLYTVDNTGITNGDVFGAPTNGEREASKSYEVTIATPLVSVSGRVWDDANGSGLADFTNITDTGTVGVFDPGANPTVTSGNPVLNAVLVGSDGKVIDITPVTTGGTAATNGTYTFTNVVGYQTGVYVILTTATATIGSNAPVALTLPAGWINTTPLSYAGTTAFALTNVNVTGKDFGIDLLPIALGDTATAVVNPTGTTSVSVAATLFTTSSTDAEDGKPTSYLITGFPTNATSIKIGATTYYPTTAAATAGGGTVFPSSGVTILATALTGGISVDPVDGSVTVAIPFKAIDKAGEVSTLGSNANVVFTAANISISGTVWNDKDRSGATGTIFTTGETGTDAVNGTSTTAVKAVLIDVTTTATLIGTATVNSTDGTYTFLNVAPSKTYKVLLVPVTTVVTASTLASLPADWVKTAEITTANFSVALVPIAGKDFGIRQKPKVVLVKRITKINKSDTGLTSRVDNTTTGDDNTSMNWPSTTGYLIGAVDAGAVKVKPGEEIEYTIYFLNNQGSDAAKVKICDAIVGAQTYKADSMMLSLNGATEVSVSDSSTDTGTDRAYSYASGSAPSGCNLQDTTVPGVAIDITGATAASKQPSSTSLPAGSYGYFRFTTTVKP
jgi:hypothetical protein